MNYTIGDVIITKKKHVCGSEKWLVERVGAEIKVKCVICNREVIMMKKDLDKRIKSVVKN